MTDLAKQVSTIETELLALTANQPPNPYDIVTYKVTRTTTVVDEIKTIVWDDGIAGFIEVYVTSGSANAPILVDSGQLKIFVSGASGITYVAISLRGFSLV
jgi:hypothetical protein